MMIPIYNVIFLKSFLKIFYPTTRRVEHYEICTPLTPLYDLVYRTSRVPYSSVSRHNAYACPRICDVAAMKIDK